MTVSSCLSCQVLNYCFQGCSACRQTSSHVRTFLADLTGEHAVAFTRPSGHPGLVEDTLLSCFDQLQKVQVWLGERRILEFEIDPFVHHQGRTAPNRTCEIEIHHHLKVHLLCLQQEHKDICESALPAAVAADLSTASWTETWLKCWVGVEIWEEVPAPPPPPPQLGSASQVRGEALPEAQRSSASCSAGAIWLSWERIGICKITWTVEQVTPTQVRRRNTRLPY